MKKKKMYCENCDKETDFSCVSSLSTLLGYWNDHDPNIITDTYICDICGDTHIIKTQYGEKIYHKIIKKW